MNNKRRAKLREALGMLSTASAIVSDAGQDESDYADNIPENMQDSEKYERAVDAADCLEEAGELIDQAVEKINEAM